MQQTKYMAALILGLLSMEPSFGSSNSAQQYVTEHQEGLFWFQNVPVGNSGIPLIMFKLFPEIFPDIWHDDWVTEIGLFPHPDPEHILPYGLGWNKGSKALVDLPGLRNIRMQVINFSCGSCHTGRVLNDDNKVQFLIGAPNTQMDLGLWRAKLAKTVNDPRYTLENFQKALAKKENGWLFKSKLMLPQELLDTKVFQSKGKLILDGIKDSVSATYDGVHSFLGVMGYDDQTRKFLDQGALGQLEGGLGSAVSKLVPKDFSYYELEERQLLLEDYFPRHRVVSDIMSVWRQSDRRLAQWDGNITAKTLRNLAAEVGVIANPDLVSYENVEYNTKFISDLPPPAYPFPIDQSKLSEGRAIFESACKSCHNEQTPLIDLETVKTDPGRSPGLTPLARELLSDLILKACIDKKNPDCNLENKDVITDRSAPQGYLAGPLDGIWARAPYLHNGSIPTLAQLLQPSKRVDRFYRGNLSYDKTEVGFSWQEKEYPYAQLYNTELSGYNNRGHSDLDIFFGGIDFEKDSHKRNVLLEYLKTL